MFSAQDKQPDAEVLNAKESFCGIMYLFLLTEKTGYLK